MNRSALAAALAVVGLASATPPATAAATSTLAGGCAFQVADTAPPYTMTMYARGVLYSTTAGDNPVSATVTCQVVTPYWSSAAVSFSGTGVIAGQRSGLQFFNYPGMQLCTTVDFTSDATPTRTSCKPAPPPTDQVTDDFLCPVLASVPVSVAGVEIDETGDLTVLGTPIWDCPPYAG